MNYYFEEWFEKWAKLVDICSQKIDFTSKIVTADSILHFLKITHICAVDHEVHKRQLDLRFKLLRVQTVTTEFTLFSTSGQETLKELGKLPGITSLRLPFNTWTNSFAGASGGLV